MSKIVERYHELVYELHTDPKLDQELYTSLSRIVSVAYTQMMNSDEGYCFRFNIPTTTVLKLYKTLNISQDKVGSSFQSDWEYPSNATMYRDPYYHILLLILYYALQEKKELLGNNALTVLLMKIWNGRKAKYIKYCDKKIMRYVVSNMMGNKNIATKYDSPLSMIRDYFVPRLLKKYGPEILSKPIKLKQLFMQSWVRFEQIFAQNWRKDIKTGRSLAQSGFLPFYMKAKSEGLNISTPSILKGNENEDDYHQYSTLSIRDEIATTTADFITMNPLPKYSNTFISSVNDFTHVSVKKIELILNMMHNHNYYDSIYNMILIILSRTNVNEKDDICKPVFFILMKKHIISSKNNVDIIKLQKLLNDFLKQIFQEKISLDFNSYSNVQQIQIRNVVIYGLVNNIKKTVCQKQMMGRALISKFT